MDWWGWRRQKAGKWVFLEMLPKMKSFYSASQNLNLSQFSQFCPQHILVIWQLSWSSSNFFTQHILVIWQGEAPILRKSACAHHVDEVTR